ncbi:MAG: HlyD family secretion protein [Gammaproteobacteria bacterium]|nr:MAG: HlyD family secretion protein [Gammaproteobacteria bacterium]RLA36942.1 MAG: HlyD family secretion protein [Gammaproteobacteria bacterium]
MELLLMLTYTAFCIAIFKIFKIPLTKWTVPTAALGGFVLLGVLFFAMNYNHPYAENTREYFYSTPITPDVAGTVIEVPVQANSPIKTGDVLFKLDPRPFEYDIEAFTAQLASEELNLVRTGDLYRTGAGSKRDYDLSLRAVDTLKANLRNAEFKLERSVVRASADGYVTQLFLKPGMRAVPIPLKPLMVFINKVPEEQYIGWFRQNSLLRLEEGSKAEIAFDALPGQVFAAEVLHAVPALGEGQLKPSDDLVKMPYSSLPGRVPVVMRITDPAFEAYRNRLPEGAYAQSAIYTEHAHHLAVLRKILLRMSSWMNYVFPLH